MNKIEKIIYDLLKGNPKIKLVVRNIYQNIFDFLPKKKNFSINSIDTKEGFFFGFHDITPFSKDNRKVLANKLTIPLRMPENEDYLIVGYFEFNNMMGKYIEIGKTCAWNYHKGCRLQWLDQNRCIFNDAINNKVISKIYNIIDNKTTIIDHSIDSVSHNGNYATSFSYERLEKLMPGYGYGYTDNAFLNLQTPSKTGLFLVNLDTNTKELIVSLRELSELGNTPKEHLTKQHYVTHTLFSKDDRYIAFLHRWIDQNVTKRWSRLIVYDRKTSKTAISPTDDMVSHFVWNSNNQIIAYCRINNIDSHYLFTDVTLKNYKQIAYPKLNSDGHQTFVLDNLFITDTYPDKYRISKLYLVNIENNSSKLIASLNSLKKFQTIDPYKHWACDLHPRMDNSGKYLCFDSTHTGTRSLCIMKVNNYKS